MKILAVNLLVISGVCFVVRGAWMAWEPAGYLVFGVLLVCAAVKLSAIPKG